MDDEALIAAMILYVPANVLPMMKTSSLFGTQSDTIMSGVVYFWTSGSWYLAADAGGGAGVVASSAARGASETFTILFVTPHITDGFIPAPARTDKRQ